MLRIRKSRLAAGKSGGDEGKTELTRESRKRGLEKQDTFDRGGIGQHELTWNRSMTAYSTACRNKYRQDNDAGNRQCF
jgi:hypothetical protein